MREELAALERLLAEPKGGALVTITRTTGSAYRREGAKMVCKPGGELVGSISGGCLESDVYEVSLQVAQRAETELVTYDTNAENDNVWGLGIGCNGTVEVLIEPLDWWRSPAGGEVFAALRERVQHGRPCAIATVLMENGERLRRAPRLLVDVDGATIGSLGHGGLDAVVAARARAIVRDEAVRPSRRVTLSHEGAAYDVFIDVVRPPLRLIVYGGGHDAIPLVEMARSLGLMVTLVDSRPQFARAERFPAADEVICAQPEEFGHKVSFEGRPALILMTHNYLKDREVLGQILTSPAAFEYVGALGPQARTEQMVDELRAQGLPLDAEKVAAIRTPIGLDLGADSPAEVALAVLAEVMAVKNRRSARPLREKRATIHAAA
jgi:xanthine/CO dehydrogenase XdhC/CoxF family maturation factor